MQHKGLEGAQHPDAGTVPRTVAVPTPEERATWSIPNPEMDEEEEIDTTFMYRDDQMEEDNDEEDISSNFQPPMPDHVFEICDV